MSGFFSKIMGRKNKEAPPFVSAVIAAAGQSRRMGENKLLLELAGLPVIIHTLLAFERAPSVSEIVLVASEKDIVEIGRLCAAFEFSKLAQVVRGGDTRQQSVLAGVLAASPEAAFVAVHDGARPLVTLELIERVVAEGIACGAAAPGIPVKDTVKRVRDGMIEETVDRETLVQIQTPQVFDVALLKGALSAAEASGRTVTDECQAVEAIGGRIRVCPGEGENLKLTTPEDVAAAEAILENR